MKIAYIGDLHMSKKNKAQLAVINEIIEEYRRQGYVLTLRQLYYQLVSRDIIPNKQSEYKKLSTLLTKGRMAGVVDWSAIEDRVRTPRVPYSVNDIEDALQDTIQQYRLNRQEGQSHYIEVWCEKDALSQVLYRVTSQYHIKLMVNRGYSSTTAMHDAAGRFIRASQRGSEELTILYVGDHDPSGLDMIRDIEERLLEFAVAVNVEPIALTQEQIEEYDPPENPAKITDPRAAWYIEQHGESSYEVDALPPQALNEILIAAIEERIDMDEYEHMLEQERNDINRLEQFILLGT